MPTVKTKILQNNQSQTVLLPKAVSLPGSIKKVEITAIGNTRIITPASKTWDEWFYGSSVTDDFMLSREQPGD